MRSKAQQVCALQSALRFSLVRIATDHTADSPEDGTFLTSTVAGLRGGSDNTPGETRERQRLEPDLPRAAQCGEEQTFAAEERGFDAADVLDVVGDGGLKSNDASGVDF